jgi:peptidoglycan hydrolase-like protein with peptidoglycan-binding domain
LPTALHRLGWSSRDAVGCTVGAVATLAIVINVVFMQSGSHPAPIFKGSLAAAKPAAPPAATGVVPKLAHAPAAPAAIPRARPAEPVPDKSASPPAAPAPVKAAAPVGRTPGEIITDIQRELARRGFYDGAVDGLYGPVTDSAIRGFEHAASLKPSAHPDEALLAAIRRAPAKLAKSSNNSSNNIVSSRWSIPVRNDPGIERSVPPAPIAAPKPSKRVLALQRALADYGYGQIRPTGIIDPETQAAIEKFERERRLPITGQPSPRVARELAAMTGRPLE